MAKFKLSAGAEIDLLTQGELAEALGQADQIQLARLNAIKHMRIPQLLTGKAAAGALALGESSGQVVGPRSGYIWSVRRLVVAGLTSGATPDVVNLFIGGPSGQLVWQFNGNNFGYTFGRLELTLYGGETLALANVGTITATGQITLSGELLETPAQLIGRLA
jgi:hypothetical protein